MGEGPTVLVVDDEPAIRQMLSEVLGDEGYRVLTATNGADALTRMRRADERPCVILLDMMMPGMNGWQLASALRDDPELAEIPFAVIGANPRHEADAHAIGARRWLGKPIDLDALLSTLEDLCDESG